MEPRLEYNTPQDDRTPDVETKERVVYRYREIEPSERSQLLAELAERKEKPSDKRYAVYEINNDDPLADLARSVEVEVFQDFFPSNNESLMQEEYGPYEESSTFLLVVDQKHGELVGVMRLIKDSPAGLKSLNDIENPEFAWKVPLEKIFAENDLKREDLPEAIDVATIAVREPYRGKLEASAALYHALHEYIVRHDIKDIVTILDDKVTRVLARIGCHFDYYKGVESAPYLDSKASTPQYTSFEKMMSRWIDTHPDTYGYVVKGDGLLEDLDVVLQE